MPINSAVPAHRCLPDSAGCQPGNGDHHHCGINYYISIAMGFSFRTRFLEMAGLSMGVALPSFLVGLAVRILLGIET